MLWGSILRVMRLLPFLGLEGLHKKSIRAQAEVISYLSKAEKTPLSQIQRNFEHFNFSDNPTVTEHELECLNSSIFENTQAASEDCFLIKSQARNLSNPTSCLEATWLHEHNVDKACVVLLFFCLC